jgi:CelD/BcsL family acetyltransferase involved in cellulose biosynthesis
LARHWGTAALVVTNLVSADALRWAAAQPPDARIGLYWAHRIPVPDDVDAWVAGDAARKKSRRELRRLWNRGTEAGLRLRILHGPQMEPLLPEITRLARETSERHGPPLYGLEMFQAASEVPGAVAIVADHPQGIAGAFIAFRGSSTLYLWAAAIDQARRRALNTYGWLAYSSIAHACATTGVDWVDFGRGNYRYKSQLGLKRHALTCLVYLTRPDPALCRRLEVMHQGLHRHAHREWTRAHATTT